MKHLPLVGAAALALVSGTAFAVVWDKQNQPPPNPPPAAPAKVAKVAKLELLTRESKAPVGIVAVPGEPVGRMFVIEREGTIRVLRGKTFDKQPFYDITGQVALWTKPNSEQGLLGLAFHPKFTDNGRVFVHYNPKDGGHTRIVELSVDKANPDRLDPKTLKEWFFLKQPYSNHKGGNLEFGPDGKLYVLLGDGGKADDPHGNGQNDETLLSKILRFDVDGPVKAPEVLGKGMRNPWRYNFDRKTGDLWIADVGQNVFEMVHMIPKKKINGPTNLGWNVVEGKHCFKAETCKKTGFHPALLDYPHSEGCSITGGYVYRGKAIPELDGAYFFSDFCTAILRSFRWKNNKVADYWDWKPALDPESTLAQVTAFGEDQDGELYITSQEGTIHKLVRAK